jgi:hypothetical protein
MDGQADMFDFSGSKACDSGLRTGTSGGPISSHIYYLLINDFVAHLHILRELVALFPAQLSLTIMERVLKGTEIARNSLN